ncbi:MAG TPA: aldehyde dehydrogenase family protein [Phycisphaerae bacterium]|nr:aldehyde dehydrogenase family protein [Phycisphaerae bacterium]
MTTAPIFIAGQWKQSASSPTFTAFNPTTGQTLPQTFPISAWSDIDATLTAAHNAFHALHALPRQQIANFLTDYADRLDAAKDAIAAIAHQETGLAVAPRLADSELPRTTNQLRQAAGAALDGSWALPTIDTKFNIRSCLAPIGPVFVMGPNNFPLAYNAISGGDFAAAIAVGNPVIAKAHPAHPATTQLLAQHAVAAAQAAQLPPGTIQLIYHMSNEDGLRLVADPRLGATGFTGSRRGGLALKAAADAAGKPIYLEMSSINPVILLPGALAERPDAIADEYTNSALGTAGQFCTKPGITILLAGPATESFISAVQQRFAARPLHPLLTQDVRRSLAAGIQTWQSAGAQLLIGGAPAAGPACCFANTLLRVSAERFLQNSRALQTEAFGNAALLIVADSPDQAAAVVETLEGNLTGSIYSAITGDDDPLYARLEPLLRHRVGRLLNDKMPTGVTVSPAMNHGGPYPATGHPHFTAVGVPAALRRFTQLQCFDHVRPHRLPPLLQDANPMNAWRFIDNRWTTEPLPHGDGHRPAAVSGGPR